MSDPVALVLAFVADHHRWNAAAHARSLGPRGDAAHVAAWEVAEREYAELLARYCRPGFAGGPISYGVPPLHDPAGGRVVSARPRGGRCLIRTRITADVLGVPAVQAFEYRLAREGGRWYLESVRCLAGGGAYESL